MVSLSSTLAGPPRTKRPAAGTPVPRLVTGWWHVWGRCLESSLATGDNTEVRDTGTGGRYIARESRGCEVMTSPEKVEEDTVSSVF